MEIKNDAELIEMIGKVMATAKYKVKVEVKVDFPWSVRHQGHIFVQTHKIGVNKATGLPCEEYQFNGRRVWLLSNGDVVPE